MSQIQSFGISDLGGREVNEDALLIDHDLGLFIICDGMGPLGKTVANAACAAAQQYVKKFIPAVHAAVSENRNSELLHLVRKAIESACQQLVKLVENQRESAGTGTTLTLLLLDGTQGVMGHVGDSRLYIHRCGRVHQLSKDHTLVGELVTANEISVEEAVRHPFSKVLTRALGRDVSVKVDTLLFELLPDDTFLLCTDGLWRSAPATAQLASFLSAKSLEEIVGQLIHHAKHMGGKDNISAIVVRSEQKEEIVATERARQERVTLQIETLRRVNLFEELPLESIFKLVDISRSKRYETGELLFQEGEYSSSLYMILKGSVTVSHNGVDIASFGAGDHFGEMALLSSAKRSASVLYQQPEQLADN